MVGKIIQIQPSQEEKVKLNRDFWEVVRYLHLAYPANEDREGKHYMLRWANKGRKC